MITRSVTIEDIDYLFLQWHDQINASALYRQALRGEMAVRDIETRKLRTLLRQARDDGTRSRRSPRRPIVLPSSSR
jgi:hypothetical protein